MKIIQTGELPGSVLKGTCPKCKTIFECTKKDFKYPGFTGISIVDCPLPGCGFAINTGNFTVLR